MVRRLLPLASFALRALTVLLLAHALSIFVHEGIHLQQAYVGGERELSITLNPTREACDGAFACATASQAFEPASFWQGEGWPRVVERVIFFEVVLGLAPWVLQPLRTGLARPWT